jgi:hypothetical protein
VRPPQQQQQARRRRAWSKAKLWERDRAAADAAAQQQPAADPSGTEPQLQPLEPFVGRPSVLEVTSKRRSGVRDLVRSFETASAQSMAQPARQQAPRRRLPQSQAVQELMKLGAK